MHGVAVDAGSGLAAALRAARGAEAELDDLLRFKRSVVRRLGAGATTVLVDAELGPGLLGDFPPCCEPMMAFEADVYRIRDEDRVTVPPDNLTVADYPRLGVRQLKFFMWYAPDDPPALNARKRALVGEVGAACRAHHLSFLMEPLVYRRGVEPGSAAFAALKPDLVRCATEAFADPSLGIDVLKVEVPVDLDHVEGFGVPSRSRAEALEAFRAAARPAAEAGIPLVYLSAGVPFDRFEASLRLAAEAGVAARGFVCGRALWSDAIGVFGAAGPEAADAWLAGEGLERLERLKVALGRP
jgi:tagatose 1,6-diphosphate aldolase